MSEEQIVWEINKSENRVMLAPFSKVQMALAATNSSVCGGRAEKSRVYYWTMLRLQCYYCMMDGGGGGGVEKEEEEGSRHNHLTAKSPPNTECRSSLKSTITVPVVFSWPFFFWQSSIKALLHMHREPHIIAILISQH